MAQQTEPEVIQTTEGMVPPTPAPVQAQPAPAVETPAQQNTSPPPAPVPSETPPPPPAPTPTPDTPAPANPQPAAPPPPAAPNQPWVPNWRPGSMQDRIFRAAVDGGVPPLAVLAIVGAESRFNPNIRNQTGSSAFGLFQMTRETMRQYGIDESSSVDEQINAGIRFFQRSISLARRALGREPTMGEIYAVHWQGHGAGPVILSNPDADLHTTLTRLVSERYANLVFQQNPNIPRGITNGQFVQLATNIVNSRARRLGGPDAVPGVPETMVPRGQGPGSIQFENVVPAVPVTQRSLEDQRLADERRLREMEQWSLARTMYEAGRNEWIWRHISPEDARFLPDPNFRATGEWFRERLRDIPEQYHNYFRDRVRSNDHADWLVGRIREEMEYDRQLASRGVAANVGIRMAMAMVDPANIALMIGTGGLATLGTSSRLARAAIMGAEGALSGAAMQIPQSMNRPGQDWDDVLMVAAAGAALGGTIGGVLRPRIPEDIVQQNQRVMGRLAEEIQGSTGGAAFVGSKIDLGSNTFDWMSKSTTDTVVRPGMEGARRIFGTYFEDFANRLARSENNVVATLGNYLVQDAVGAANRNQTVRFAASEMQRSIQVRTETALLTEVREAYADYATRHGFSLAHRNWDGFLEFDRQVTTFLRNTDPTAQFDPAVARAGQANRQMYDAMHQLGRDPGSALEVGRPGSARAIFDEDQRVENYFPRIINELKLTNLRARVSDDMIQAGVSRAIRNAQPNISQEMAEKIAKAWFQGHVERSAGMRFNVAGSLDSTNLDGLQALLRSSGMAEGEIDNILHTLRPASKADDAGNHSRARHRVLMDENYVVQARGYDGSMQEFRLADLWEDNATEVARIYIRQMSAQVAMANVQIRNPMFGKYEGAPEFLVNGLHRQGDWESLMNQARAVYDQMGIKASVRESELKALQRVYNLINGIPDKQDMGNIGFAIRFLQKLNFTRLMNQVGLAQLPEAANVPGQLGVRATMQSMPMYRRMVEDAVTGQMDNKLAREIVYMTGAGTEWVRGFNNMADDIGSGLNITGNSAFARNAERFIDKAARGTQAISLMAPINYGLQRLAAGAVFAKFANMAGGKSPVNMNRLRVMGLSDADAEAVFDQIRRHAGRTGLGPDISGASINTLNMDRWDPQVLAKFQNAVFRWTRQVIQENDVGQLNMVTSYAMGRLFMQFRTFMVGAWTKQFLHNIHMRDWETFNTFMYGLVFGSLTFVATTHLQSIGRSDREQFLRERLGTDDKRSSEMKIAMGGLQRTGYSSIFPFLTDNIRHLAGYDPLFSNRMSGTPSAGLLQFPTVGLYDAAAGTTREVFRSMFQGDGLSQADIRRAVSLSFFQNFLPIQWILSATMGAAGVPVRDERSPR